MTLRQGTETGILTIVTVLTIGNLKGETLAASPAFDCDHADGAIEEMICGDEGLAALDRKLSAVYRDVAHQAANEHPSVLRAEQRGWIKGRNDC